MTEVTPAGMNSSGLPSTDEIEKIIQDFGVRPGEMPPEQTPEDTGRRSPISMILGTIVLVVGIIIYAVTGVDLLGVQNRPELDPDLRPSISRPLTEFEFEQGLGYGKDFWRLYFTAPTGNSDRRTYQDGIDRAIAEDIAGVQQTLDIAAFELNNQVITEAIRAAHERGVQVRIVTDNNYGILDDITTLRSLRYSGVKIIDDRREGLMHNKFMILDGITVWTGSWNYTSNGTYRNNNNAMAIRSRRVAEVYQQEFNEMFEQLQFGPRSSESNTANLRVDGTSIEIYFAPENEVIELMNDRIRQADLLRFFAFAFTEDNLGNTILEEHRSGQLVVQGVFETTGSETIHSEMGKFHCAGMDVFQDGNRRVMHHKVMLLDDDTVIFGSFNFSDNATRANDENLVIIQNRDIFQLFEDEFRRVLSIAKPVNSAEVDCRLY